MKTINAFLLLFFDLIKLFLRDILKDQHLLEFIIKIILFLVMKLNHILMMNNLFKNTMHFLHLDAHKKKQIFFLLKKPMVFLALALKQILYLIFLILLILYFNSIIIQRNN